MTHRPLTSLVRQLRIHNAAYHCIKNPGAVDPKVDSPRPSAEIFLPYIEKKIVSALGRGRSKGGFSAPERRKFSPLYREIVSALGRGRSKGGFSAPERRNFSPLYREENRFRARARKIQRWILRARAQKIFSPI